jgi:hypothetical protein
VAGIALPHSVNLGQVFKRSQVKHVLCFDDANPNVTPGQYEKEDLDDLVRFQFNYIYCFCVEFYTNIANQMSVIASFNAANEWINNDLNQYEQIWQ